VKRSRLGNRFTNRQSLRLPANAELTPLDAATIAQLMGEQGWTAAAAARTFMMKPTNSQQGGATHSSCVAASRYPAQDPVTDV
jgi:hypothetical protein